MSQQELKEALKTLFTAADIYDEGRLGPEGLDRFLRAVSQSLLYERPNYPLEINFQGFD
jgi:hypothetical protein